LLAWAGLKLGGFALAKGKPDRPRIGQTHRAADKPERGVREIAPRQPAKQALGAAQFSKPSSDDKKDAYAALTDALGTTNPDFVEGLFGHLLEACARGAGKYDKSELFFMLAVITEKKAKDPLVAMQLAQMGAVHAALMKAAGEVAQAEFLPHKEFAMRAVNQLGRTFAAQLDGLKRYLSAPLHNVSVSVSEGGQAIVGTVTQAADRAAPAAAANVRPAISDARRVPMETLRDDERITLPLRVPLRKRTNVASQPDTEDKARQS
jgi:hypothetical protein